MSKETVPFEHSNYNYKVGLGTLIGRDSISWDVWVWCRKWKDVKAVTEAWEESRDYPAFHVKQDYHGERPGGY